MLLTKVLFGSAQGPIYWGAGGEASPPKKKFFLKKFKAISNTDLIWNYPLLTAYN